MLSLTRSISTAVLEPVNGIRMAFDLPFEVLEVPYIPCTMEVSG